MIIDGKEYVLKAEVEGGDESNPYMKCRAVYFVRTVTQYLTGRLVWVGDKELVFADACWIADTGRFADFLKDKNKVCESEPFPKTSYVIVGRGSIVDMVEYIPGTITEQK